MMMDDIKDRAVGCLLGLAIGDAVGTTVEFKARGSFRPLTDMVGGGPFRLQPGQWTDDTSMALCLAESLLADPELDPGDLMARFERWYRLGENASTGRCFDIGITTRAAILHYQRTGDPLAGQEDPRQAGNGSIMRLAPASLRWWHAPATLDHVARLQSRTTHGAQEAVDACALLAHLLAGLIAGDGRPALTGTPPDAGWAPSIQTLARATWTGKADSEIQSSGYVVHTLEAALWSVHSTETFEDAILKAANLGEDADTVAAVAGQIAGALYGKRGMPGRWLSRLTELARIERLADGLITAAAADMLARGVPDR